MKRPSRFPDVGDLAQLQGELRPAEGQHLTYLASHCERGAIVEVGSFKGKSACYLARGTVTHVYCVDLWALPTPGRQKRKEKYVGPRVFGIFRQQVKDAGVSQLVTPLPGESVDLAAHWANGPIGLLFIDAKHTYHAVREDLQAWTPHLAPGACVAFHDWKDTFPGVARAGLEWQQTVDVVSTYRVLEQDGDGTSLVVTILA